MPHSQLVSSILLLLAFCFVNVQSTASGNQIQFYDSGTNYGVAIASAIYANGTQIRMLLTAPLSYGWAAVGTGHMMDGSAMFIVYPDKAGDALILSIRTTDGHDTPKPFESGKINATLLNSSVKDGKMSALIQWSGNANGVIYDACSVTNPAQPFIWAVGPDQKIASSDLNFGIKEHSQYGVFFANMPQSQNMAIADPVIQGVNNHEVRPQPGAYHHLIVLHAALLVGAFLIVFPAAVVGLRLNLPSSFRIHWMSQVFASVASLAGLIVAIITSIIGIRFSQLNQPHQLIGILVCGLVGLQVYFGREHHVQFVLHQKRTWYSYVHLVLGRVVIYGGMVNAVLGFRLAGLDGVSLAACGFALLVIIVVEVMSVRHHLRRAKKQVQDVEPLILKGYARTPTKDVAVEERMLSDFEVNTGYSR